MNQNSSIQDYSSLFGSFLVGAYLLFVVWDLYFNLTIYANNK
jgi:hypothetical protein